jgi:FtsZ-binding cell division protein ZapB
MDIELNQLKIEIENLKLKNKELEDKLKSYSNPERYYEKNSNIVKEKAKNYMEKINYDYY